MERPQGNRHEFSQNQFSVSGGDVRVQYGNNYQSRSISVRRSTVMLMWRFPVPQTSETSWGDVSNWISGTGSNFSQRTFQRSMQRRRTENRTGSCFLDGEAFIKWMKTPGSFLWLHGKSSYKSLGLPSFNFLTTGAGGCGKTMLW